MGSGEERLLASGGGDARVQVWQDCTVEDKQEAAQEQETALLKQQRLSNALQVQTGMLLFAFWLSIITAGRSMPLVLVHADMNQIGGGVDQPINACVACSALCYHCCAL